MIKQKIGVLNHGISTHPNISTTAKGHNFWARRYYVSTVGLDEGRVRKYIQNQEENETIEDKYERDLSNPF